MECSFFLGHNDSHNSMCISQAAAKGAKRIIGVDKSPSKEDLGKRFAGDNFEFVNPDKHPDKSVDEILVDKSGSGGVAYCFEAVGSIGTMEASVRSVHKGGGVTCLVGVAPSGQKMSLPPVSVVCFLRGVSSL